MTQITIEDISELFDKKLKDISDKYPNLFKISPVKISPVKETSATKSSIEKELNRFEITPGDKDIYENCNYSFETVSHRGKIHRTLNPLVTVSGKINKAYYR